MNLVERVLLDHYHQLGLDDVGLGKRLQTALLTPQFVTSRHVVALVFAPGDPRPRAVVKIPRRPGDNGGVQREAEMLRWLAAAVEHGVPGVPSVLGTVDVDGRTLLVETVVSGDPLDPVRVQRDRDGAVTVGVDFVRSLPLARAPMANSHWYDTAVAQPLADLAERLPLGERIPALCRRTHAVLEPLREVRLPAVVEHGDLSHPNIFLIEGGARLGVVDWERSTVDGVPGHDLVFFLQYVSESASSAFTRPAQVAAFDAAFVGPGAWAVPVLRQHLRVRGVDPDLLELLVVACWARAAATLVSRLVPEEGPGERPLAAALHAAVIGDRDVQLWQHAVEQADRGQLAHPG